jgi:hypothetical protein
MPDLRYNATGNKNKLLSKQNACNNSEKVRQRIHSYLGTPLACTLTLSFIEQAGWKAYLS